MEFRKVRSYTYIFDGGRAVGRVKTQAQAKRYMEDAGRHKTADEFRGEFQKLVDFTAAIEDEMGYEFHSKKDVLDLMQKRWPEVYDVDVDFDTGRFKKASLSGNGWCGAVSFRGDSATSTVEDLDEMTRFAASCGKHGMKIENYKEPFRANIGGSKKSVMPVGFTDDGRLVIRLEAGSKQWLVKPELIRGFLKA